MIKSNPFYKLKLDPEEQEIEDALEAGNLVSIPNFAEEKKRYEAIARNTLNKTKNVNIRISLRTLYNLKVRAAEEGIPCQTLMASVLHKYATGKLDCAL